VIARGKIPVWAVIMSLVAATSMIAAEFVVEGTGVMVSRIPQRSMIGVECAEESMHAWIAPEHPLGL
jgi:hypothetical protein